jgi:hypothetical protein
MSGDRSWSGGASFYRVLDLRRRSGGRGGCILHAYRWRNQLILFDEVDVNTQIEVEAECPGGAWGVPIDAPQPTRGAGEGCGGT